MKVKNRLLSAAVLLLLTALLYFLSHEYPRQFFSVYPAVSAAVLGALGAVSNQVSFPLWQVLAAGLLIFALFTLVRSLGRRKFLRWLSGLLWAGCFGVFFFTAAWGVGHFGPTKTQQVLSVEEYSARELKEAAVFYGRLAEQFYEPLGDEDFAALAEKAGDGYAVLAETSDLFAPAALKVKPLLFGKAFSYMGITGIFVPMTAEAGVNPNTYPPALPHTMCHELAHRLGVTAEEDANFCAFLACMNHADRAFRYSACYSAFIYCYNALYAQSPDMAREAWFTLTPRVQEDIRGASAHYEPYEGPVQEAAESFNDTYLKAFEQEGVRSYGLVSDALIAWYLENHENYA